MSVRSIREVVPAVPELVGGSVTMLSVIGQPSVEAYDPFLKLYAFDFTNPEDYIKGIPWHPHRGIETVTYLIRGDIEHGDSLGNKGRIIDGGCQWLTAGRGIMHKEMPRPSDGEPDEEKETFFEETERMLGAQVWLNMPGKDKMAAPKTRDIPEDRIPRITRDGCTISVVSGHYENMTGAFQGEYVRMLFLDVEMEPGARWVLETEQDATLFVYILEGSGWFGEADHQLVSARNAILFHKGDEFIARAEQNGLHFLLFSAKQLREPVAWNGSIVMNTDEELSQAARELRQGTFIK